VEGELGGGKTAYSCHEKTTLMKKRHPVKGFPRRRGRRKGIALEEGGNLGARERQGGGCRKKS